MRSIRTAAFLVSASILFCGAAVSAGTLPLEQLKSGTDAPVIAPVPASAPARVTGSDVTAEYAAAFKKAGAKGQEGAQKLKGYKFILVSGLFSNIDKSKLPLARKKPAAKPKPHFAEQIAWLKSIGAEYELLSMKSESSVQVNAAIISAAIKASDKPVMIVASSKGGLDVLEALVAERELAPKVRGVVMCQIPFLGTPVADYVMEHRGIAGPLSRFLERVGGSIDSMMNLTTADRKAYLESNAAAISAVISAVPIISISTWKDPSEKDQDTALRPLRNWMLKRGLKNDGLVTVDSAILPGTDYIKIPGVDHGATIKKTKKIEFDRARFAEAVFMMLLARQAN